MDSQAADDFMLTGTAKITALEWVGGFWNGSPLTVPQWNIMFYEDAGGKPTGGPTDPTDTAVAVYHLSGDDVLPETDVEPDGLNNLMEYALGGNPTNDDAAAVSPKTYTADDGGTDYFYHVSDQRDGDASLTFTLGSEIALTGTPTWDTNDVSFVGESMATNDYKTVTNRTEATPSAKFIKLEVQQN